MPTNIATRRLSNYLKFQKSSNSVRLTEQSNSYNAWDLRLRYYAQPANAGSDLPVFHAHRILLSVSEARSVIHVMGRLGLQVGRTMPRREEPSGTMT